MPKRLAISASLLLLQLSSQSFGALDEYTVYYLNGMNNSPAQAISGRNKLHDLAIPDVPSSSVMILYQNNTGALVEMVQKVAQQGTLDTQREAFKNFWKCVSAPTPEKCAGYPSTPGALQIVNETLAKYDETAYVQNAQLQRLVGRVSDNYYTNNKKSLIVSHSQGNFYANQIVNYLQSFDPAVAACVDIVGVASPATYVAKSGLYETRNDDAVINAARSFFPWGASILPPTAAVPDDPFFALDGFGHNFIDAYLRPNSMRKRIREDIVLQTLTVADSPCQLCTPFNENVSGAFDDSTYPKHFVRKIGAGKRTINVRFDFTAPANTPYDGGYSHYGSVYVRARNANGSINFLLDLKTPYPAPYGRQIYRGSFVFDSTQLGTTSVEVDVYATPTSTANVCVDCGYTNSLSPTACP